MKQFLKGGEAEEYEGVTVEYIRGRKPVLTIYEDGNKREEVDLSKYDDVDALRALMAAKGFHKKTGGGGGGKEEKVAEVVGAKMVKGVSRLETTGTAAKVTRGAQGELINNPDDYLESGPVHTFGYLTGAAIGGFVIFSVAKSRTKNARNVL